MITLTRLSGTVFVLNSDLIERIDSTPDTVITLVDGKKYVVAEPLTDVVDAVRAYRGESHRRERPHAGRPPRSARPARDRTSPPSPVADRRAREEGRADGSGNPDRHRAGPSSSSSSPT